MSKYTPVDQLTVEEHAARRAIINLRYKEDKKKYPDLVAIRKQRKAIYKKNLRYTNPEAFEKAKRVKHLHQKRRRDSIKA